MTRGGRTAAGIRSAVSHTAALATDDVVARTLLASAGVFETESLDEFEDLLRLLVRFSDRPPAGRFLGAVSNAGFECVAIADNLGPLTLARFERSTVDRLRFPPFERSLDRHGNMPLEVFELDNVAVLDANAPHGVREERRLCFVEVGVEVGYANARAHLDALLRELGAEATYEPLDHPAFTAGRAATFQAGDFRGTLGELHPEVVTNFGLDHPVALVELTVADI